jgi:alkylation response protein AidB-like acyl-CoA dehydrogenase
MNITTIAEEFARTRILPRAPVWEKSRAMATAELREAINAGIGSIRIAAEHGGLGLDYSSTGAARLPARLRSTDRPLRSLDIFAKYKRVN